MQKILIALSSIALLAGVVGLVISGSADAPGLTAQKVKGVNVLFYSQERNDVVDSEYTADFADYIGNTGATHAALAFPLFMYETTDDELHTTPDTPSVDELRALVAELKDSDIKVTLKPIIDGRSNGFTRTQIAPTDVSGWFDSYQGFINPYIDFAQEADLYSFALGVELTSLEQYQDEWTALINESRSRYDGRITYASNWGTGTPGYVSELDYYGVDAYPPHSGNTDPESLQIFWDQIVEDIAIEAKIDRNQLILHEYGISSESNAQNAPWGPSNSGQADVDLQSNWLSAACGASRNIGGGYVWSAYFGTDLMSDNSNDLGFNIIGKSPSEIAILDCFST